MTLIEILTLETKSLKVQYLDLTKTWAIANFETCKIRSSWNEAKWCEYFGLEPRKVNAGSYSEFLGFPTGFYNSKDSSTYYNMKNSIRSICTLGLEKYVAKRLQAADLHYKMCIEKLAYRIQLKGLNQDAIKAHTSHVGVNINTTLTDGVKSVRAFTIIASGPVQCPHYRYLIK